MLRALLSGPTNYPLVVLLIVLVPVPVLVLLH
jgi:hypothetical protein